MKKLIPVAFFALLALNTGALQASTSTPAPVSVVQTTNTKTIAEQPEGDKRATAEKDNTIDANTDTSLLQSDSSDNVGIYISSSAALIIIIILLIILL